MMLTNATLMALYILRERMIDLARNRVEGISETIVYTIGPMEKSAVADIRSTIVPAAHDVAVVCLSGIPMHPVTLFRLANIR